MSRLEAIRELAKHDHGILTPEAAQQNDLKPDRPELNVNQKEDLTRLRRWIFNQQTAHLKAKRNATENGGPAPAPEVVEQPRIF
jgi:hypothetical protein